MLELLHDAASFHRESISVTGWGGGRMLGVGGQVYSFCDRGDVGPHPRLCVFSSQVVVELLILFLKSGFQRKGKKTKKCSG